MTKGHGSNQGWRQVLSQHGANAIPGEKEVTPSNKCLITATIKTGVARLPGELNNIETKAFSR